TTPASAAPNSKRTHSGRFGAQTATRSPGEKRARSARATCSASARTSAKVQRRSTPGTPATSPTTSGESFAASRNRSPTVRSRSGTDRSAGQYDSVSFVTVPLATVRRPECGGPVGDRQLSTLGSVRAVRLSLCVDPGRPWPDVRRLTEGAEAVGLDRVYVCDHFMPSADPRGPNFECSTTIAALSACTDRIGLGTLVLGNTYRHPAVVAKIACTLDHATNGRFVLGLGAGWQVNEHNAY